MACGALLGTSPSVVDSLERLVLLVEDEGRDARSQHGGSKVDDPVDLFPDASRKSNSAQWSSRVVGVLRG